MLRLGTAIGKLGGGELVVENGHAPVAFKAAAGDAVLYPSGSIHQVKPVESGVRLVAVTWLQSLVRDPEQRRQLFELSETIALVEAQGANADTLLRLRASLARNQAWRAAR